MTSKKSNVDPNGKPDASQEAPQQEIKNGKERPFWGKAPNVPAAKPTADEAVEEQSSEPDQAAQHAILTATIASLEHRLQDKENRLNATVGQYKEALEEFEGAKSRLKRDVAKDVAKGKRAILTGLLEVVDNLERALTAAKEASETGGKEFRGFFEGVCMVRDQFESKLSALGVARIACLGQPFDPMHFEAISTVPVSDPAQHDTVVGVVRDAYLLDDETLRHGIVAVGKKTE